MAAAVAQKKISAHGVKNLIFGTMKKLSHRARPVPAPWQLPSAHRVAAWRLLGLLGAVGLAAGAAHAQIPGRPSGAIEAPSTLTADPMVEKPEKAAQKAYQAGMKSLNKAKDAENAAASAANPDKKAKFLGKMQDALNNALDQFTEALSQKGDMFDAWNQVGYVHLRLGAFGESLDDYNHALALKPDDFGAVEGRAEASLALDHLEDAKSDYMNLASHDGARAARLQTAMQQWLVRHQADPGGVRPADVEAFQRWLAARDTPPR